MKCVILAAGYATRLYPLTENFPKPLLDVGGKTIIDWLISDIADIKELTEIIVVSNDKFYSIFQDWEKKTSYPVPIKILNDGSTTNDNRCGAVIDLAIAIREGKIDEDLLVLAGDNITDFSLKGFYTYFQKKQATCIMRYCEDRVEKLRKTGVIQIDQVDKVINMEEKPQEPKSNWAVPPFYLYTASDLKRILEAVDKKCCETDAPGSFISYFCKENKVFAYPMPGKRYDIGDVKSYNNVKKNFLRK